MTYHKILVGIDGSEHGAKALREAVKLAGAFKAELHVFHAIKHHFNYPFFPLTFETKTLVTDYSTAYSQDQMQQAYLESGKQILEQAKQQVEEMHIPLEGEVYYHLETDIPPPEFVEWYAKEHNVDLVVVGCAGHHSRIRTALMGTVATSIMNNAPCQVLVVR